MKIVTFSLLAVGSSALSSSTPAASMQNQITGKMILAPLTKGGNLPFRRLCADFGMEVSLSEMVYARSLLRGSPVEQARLRRWEGEEVFGVQIATNQVEEGINAIQKLQETANVQFCDLNCGCPIYDVTRRGLGSSLLRSPKKLHRLVKGLVDGTDIPITVKIRVGCESDTINVLENVKEIREAGASAITIHGRTAQQGYSKDANWELIQQAVEESKKDFGHIPIIGNGDILTHYEARRRMEETGVHSIMVGRGALIKPWIFKEFNDNAAWSPTSRERIEIYYTLANYMKEHFGDDEMGRKKAWTFLPWHFEFLSRYSPFPEKDFAAQSVEKPLIQSRHTIETDDPVDMLLANRSSDAHNTIASILWESDSNEVAFRKLSEYSESTDFNNILMTGSSLSSSRVDQVLANKFPGKAGRWNRRRGRKPGPKRSEAEIAAIRAERALKKQKILAEGGEWPPN